MAKSMKTEGIKTENLGTTLLTCACLAGGCGVLPVGVAPPEALLAFSPRPDDRAAAITAIKSSGERTYVGFSDGEMFFRANGAAAWDVYDTGPPGCDQPVPRGPITAFAITEATVFTAYAGTPGAPGIWRSPEERPCWARELIADDFLNLSVSPFSTIELLAYGEGARWATQQLGIVWDQQGKLPSLGFDGDARAMATGVGPAGGRRAWLGDGTGRVYYSDDPAAPSGPVPVTWHPVTPDPGFPPRPVVAIAVAPGRPQTVWVTFFGVAVDSLWRSDDGGTSWRNPRGGELSSVV
ncbi:MAG TPA: hypothetical protein VIU64_24005, partial [Polyangia bacterium]